LAVDAFAGNGRAVASIVEIVRVNATLALAPVESVTSKMREISPVAAPARREPEMTPELASRASPDGRFPDVIDHLEGWVPPATMSVAE
jgi:hypothetical protein